MFFYRKDNKDKWCEFYVNRVSDREKRNGDEAAAADGGLDEDKFFDNGDGEEEEMTKEEKNQAYLDSINDGDDGYGKSTSGRNAWKQKHGKGKFNRKVQQDKHDQLHKW